MSDVLSKESRDVLDILCTEAMTWGYHSSEGDIDQADESHAKYAQALEAMERRILFLENKMKELVEGK